MKKCKKGNIVEMKDRIIEGALDLFSRYGQSRVRMEEIAAYIHVSKKTIYNHFQNKTVLFAETVNFYTRKMVVEMTRIISDESKDFGAKLHEFLSYSYMELGRKDSPFFKDLRQYNNLLEDSPILYIRKHLADLISSFITTAKEDGNITSEIDTLNATYVFLNIMQGIISWDDRDNLPISRVEILRSTIQIALEGLLTQKGKQLVKETFDE